MPGTTLIYTVRFTKVAFLFLVAILLVSGCDQEKEYAPVEPSVMWKILPDTTLSVFLDGMNRLGRSRELNNVGSAYTVFPVANAGLRAFLADTARHEGFAGITDLNNDRDVLAAIINYHIAEGVRLTATDLQSTSVINTAQGGQIAVSMRSAVMLNNKATLSVERTASNGVVHMIDSLLIPDVVNIRSLRQTIRDESNLSTFYEAIQRLSATNATIKGYFNGTNSLRTVFAPTNEAFAAYFRQYPADISVTRMNATKLLNLVNYHILQTAGKRNQASFTGTAERTSLVRNGTPVMITVNGAPFTYGESPVHTPDITAFRGLIHVIDKISVPTGGF